MLINIPLLIEVARENRVNTVTLAKMVTRVGAEYAVLKSDSEIKIDFGKIIKFVCGTYRFDDLFGHLSYETAVGQYFGKAKKQKADLDIVLLSRSRVRVRVGECTFAEYTISRSYRWQDGVRVEVYTLQHHANIRGKGVRYDDALMSSKTIEAHALAWLEKQKQKAVR
ncbi:MAG: hypothetical protein RLZZ76_381 [Candidatus Parcubacteria bacterium]|jgi:hypothetical protein